MQLMPKKGINRKLCQTLVVQGKIKLQFPNSKITKIFFLCYQCHVAATRFYERRQTSGFLEIPNHFIKNEMIN